MEWFLGCVVVGIIVVVYVKMMLKSIAKEAVSLGELEMSCICIVADRYREEGETLDEAIERLPGRLNIDMSDTDAAKVVAAVDSDKRRYIFPFFFGGG